MRAAQTVQSDARGALETRSWFAVVRAYLECSRRYAQMLQHFELTVAQFDVLVAIDTLADNALPKQIAEQLVVTRANVTGVLQRLVERGLVETQRHSSDARSLLCELTPAGNRLLLSTRAAAARFVRAQAAPFSDAELNQVMTMMRDMHAHLQTLDPAALARGDDAMNP